MIGTVEPSAIAAFGAIPGVIGLLGAAAAFWRTGVRAGRIEQRLADVETDVADMKGMKETMARVDERTKGTAGEVASLRSSVDRFVEIVLQSRQGGGQDQPPRQRQR